MVLAAGLREVNFLRGFSATFVLVGQEAYTYIYTYVGERATRDGDWRASFLRAWLSWIFGLFFGGNKERGGYSSSFKKIIYN